MEAEASRRVMTSVVAPRTARASDGREGESRVGMRAGEHAQPRVQKSLRRKRPLLGGSTFPTSRDLNFCVNVVPAPRYGPAVATPGSGGL